MKKCLSVLLGVLLLLSVGTPALRSPVAHAATMAELEQEVSRIEAEIAANKEKLSDLAGK